MIEHDDLGELEGSTPPAAASAQIDRFIVRYGQMLGAVTLPKVKIRNNIASKWLGRTLWKCSNVTTTLMELQKSILSDPKTLERVVAHEMVHHVELTTMPVDQMRALCSMLQSGRRLPKDRGHAARFLDLAKIVNDQVGEDFVTVTSDESYVVEETKEFMVMVVPAGDGRFAYSWGVRMTPMLTKLVNHWWNMGGRVSKSTDTRWTHGPKFGKGFGIPRSAEDQASLKKLHDNAFWRAPG